MGRVKRRGQEEPRSNHKKSLFQSLWDFLQAWYWKFTKDRINILASGIVYTTLISIVPFISFLVAFLSLFNVLQPFYTLLTDLFTNIFGEVAGSQLVGMVTTYSVNASRLGVVGLLSFVVTTLLLINKVWSVINQIYRTSGNRGGVVKRAVSFLTILIVGALLFSAYISVKSLLSGWMAKILGWQTFNNFAMKALRLIAPWVIGWLFLFFMIKVGPNAKVSGVSASIGGVVGTLGLYVINLLFSTIITSALNYSVIYGSFAAVFFFLLWVHFIWIVVLSAVEVSYVHQYRPDRATIKRPISPAEQLANGVNVMMVIGQKYRTQGGDTRIRDITDRLFMDEKALYGVIELLIKNGFIISTNNMRTAFVPARPLEDLKVIDLVEALYGEVYLEQNLDTIGDAIASQIDEKGIKTLGSLSLANLIERV
jgi:membrane protein